MNKLCVAADCKFQVSVIIHLYGPPGVPLCFYHYTQFNECKVLPELKKWYWNHVWKR
jgi:hypothetical protein